MKGRRLQNRIARSISFAVLVSFLAGGLVLLGFRHTLTRRSMESAARTYAALVSLPVVETVNLFQSTGRHILERRVARWRSLNDDLVVIEVVDVAGRVIMSSDGEVVTTFSEGDPKPMIDDSELLSRVRSLELSAARVSGAEGESQYRVVAPAVEEWGRHTYSVVAIFSYHRANRELLNTAWVMAIVLLAALLVANRIAVRLASTITRSVDRLHAGVQRLQEGHLEERVEVRSNDEIEELAEAFNSMADNLVETIERLRQANRELEHLDQAKADLVANVSHELKTPLTALRGYLELMEQGDLGPLPAQAQQAAEVCQKNVKRLALRIEELVQLADLEKSFAADPIVEDIHLGTLLHGVVETLLPKLEDEEVLCSLNLATDLPSVLANSEQLERVFLNLLDNARKFTAAGGFIRVSAEPYDRDNSPGVVIRVADTGVGVPSAELLRIFDRFYQIDPSSRRKHGGMGLGLSLVRSIVEAHRGSVWVESVEGRGSTFFVWLPRNPVGSSGECNPAKVPSSDATLRITSHLGKQTEGAL